MQLAKIQSCRWSPNFYEVSKRSYVTQQHRNNAAPGHPNCRKHIRGWGCDMIRMQIMIYVGYHCVDMTNVLDEGA